MLGSGEQVRVSDRSSNVAGVYVGAFSSAVVRPHRRLPGSVHEAAEHRARDVTLGLHVQFPAATVGAHQGVAEDLDQGF